MMAFSASASSTGLDLYVRAKMHVCLFGEALP